MLENVCCSQGSVIHGLRGLTTCFTHYSSVRQEGQNPLTGQRAPPISTASWTPNPNFNKAFRSLRIGSNYNTTT